MRAAQRGRVTRHRVGESDQPVLLLTFISQVLQEPERFLSREREAPGAQAFRGELNVWWPLEEQHFPLLCVHVCKRMRLFFPIYLLAEDVINLRDTGQVLLCVTSLGL